MPLSIEQFVIWGKEADELWDRRVKNGSERPHPAVEFHAKLAFRRGYMSAMAKVSRESASSN